MLLKFGRHSVHLHSCAEGTLLGRNMGSKIQHHWCTIVYYCILLWSIMVSSCFISPSEIKRRILHGPKRPAAGAPQPFWPSAQLHPDRNWCQTWLEERSCLRGTKLLYCVQGREKEQIRHCAIRLLNGNEMGMFEKEATWDNLSMLSSTARYCKK